MMAMMVSEIGGLAIGQTDLMGQKWLVSADSQEFNLEDEGRTSRDSGLGEFAVAHLCRDVQFPLVADNHAIVHTARQLEYAFFAGFVFQPCLVFLYVCSLCHNECFFDCKGMHNNYHIGIKVKNNSG